jgi:hypothetical protein
MIMLLPAYDYCHDGRMYRVLQRTPGSGAYVYPSAEHALRSAAFFQQYGAEDDARQLREMAEKVRRMNATIGPPG